MSRELTAHEREVARQRLDQLEELQAAALDMLDELREGVGLDASTELEAAHIDTQLAARADEFAVDPMARVWWLTRLGVWVAHALCDRHAGDWFIDPDPRARTFLRAVVGRFGGRSDTARYDPMQVASVVVDGGESLETWLSAIEDELGLD